MNQDKVPDEARQHKAQLIDAIIAQHPYMTREDLEEDFEMWNFEEYSLLRSSGLLDPLIRAQDGDDDLTRAQRVEDFLKGLRMWGKHCKYSTTLYTLSHIVYRGIRPELSSGVGHEGLTIAELRAQVMQLEHENTTLANELENAQDELANQEVQLERAQDRIEILEEELEGEKEDRREDLAQQANILALIVARVKQMAGAIDFGKEIVKAAGRTDDAARTEGYEMMERALEELNNAVIQLADVVNVPRAEDMEE
ncbi:hypothetical protein QBC32DRAFT_332849 [Pseudoneurospora amorphoporcata]|uniref:Uncharacterized protein n=1 Tax=Pseudoneurospora amorphoporcata TaxID=241081 RepID=A0AAN6SJ89_9PEZI|nr:hypothetical protein QBC32DRAFT_332849 [Pseudoneurospora amorphoporcata]